MPTVASLDLGTNTFRLLIAEALPGQGLSPLLSKRAITRLGEGYAHGKLIQPSSIERAMAVLKDFAECIARYRVEKVFAVATGVVREAENGEAFTGQVLAQTGIGIKTLTGFEEARLTLKGVLSAVTPETAHALVFDIGGGSTEFILTEDTLPRAIESIALGVVFLSDRHLTADPPTARELLRLRAAIQNRLSRMPLLKALPPEGPSSLSLIGTAGTVTTLAAIDQKMEIYDPGAINSHRLSRETLLNIYRLLSTLTAAQRTAIPGLEKGRERVIVPGTAIVLEIMDLFHCNQIIVSDAGLLEGILVDRQTLY